MVPAALIPTEVLHAYDACDPEVVRLSGGLINQTFLVKHADERAPFILQRMHKVFGETVNRDIDAVTRHLCAAGLETPRIIPTQTGALWVESGGGLWRALSYIDGVTVDCVPSVLAARSAGDLVGRFHRALTTFEYSFRHVRPGVHDTAAFLTRLENTVTHDNSDGARLGAAILACATQLRPIPEVDRRICHGDLKISNVMFDRNDPDRAKCLVDLDTVGKQTLAYELGDALRSWCNRAGEDNVYPVFDIDLFCAAMQGYATAMSGLMTTTEALAIVCGLETVCVELAARFCIDAYEDCYFGWDNTRFASRVEHNLVRAAGQLALAGQIMTVRGQLDAAANDAVR